MCFSQESQRNERGGGLNLYSAISSVLCFIKTSGGYKCVCVGGGGGGRGAIYIYIAIIIIIRIIIITITTIITPQRSIIGCNPPPHPN